MGRERVIERTVYFGSNNRITNEFSWRDERNFQEGFIDFSDVSRYQLSLDGMGVVLDTTSVDGSQEIDISPGRGLIDADLTDLNLTASLPAGQYHARIMVWRPQDTKGWLIADRHHPLNRLVYRFVA